ncbi:MAG: DUF1778 domain-containing protein [Gammaproteobacteria bacterium]|nr:MAG: DUF1778 domain-containing protein [Gammaproteobacteria bacterium]
MSSLALKDARMELKTSKRLKDMLNSAASLAGQDLTAFVLASAEDRAKLVLSEYQSLSLLHQEQIDFMAALTKPAKPTKALKELMSMESLVER